MTSLSCYYDVMKLLLWRHQAVTMASSSCYYDVTKLLLWRHQAVTMTSSICYYDVIKLLLWHHKAVNMTSLDCCYDVIKPLLWRHWAAAQQGRQDRKTTQSCITNLVEPSYLIGYMGNGGLKRESAVLYEKYFLHILVMDQCYLAPVKNWPVNASFFAIQLFARHFFILLQRTKCQTFKSFTRHALQVGRVLHTLEFKMF